MENEAYVSDDGKRCRVEGITVTCVVIDRENGTIANGGSNHLSNAAPTPPQVTVREKWGKNVEFLLSCVALSVGFGNVWRFPYTAFNNGGGAFVIPYLIVLLIIGRPVYYLEMVMGQFSNRGCVKVYDLAPAMRGIGVGQTVAIFSVITYYAAVLAITFRYLVASFSTQLPWSKCEPQWEDCVDSSYIGMINAGNRTNVQTSAELFFRNSVLHKADSLDDGIGLPDWELVICLIVSWACIIAILIRGIKSSGKFSYFLAIFPYVIIFILLIRSVTLPGAWNGIKYFFTPDWNKLLTIEVWYEAVTQCFFSLTICFGGLIVYSSFNNFHNDIYRHAVIITWLDTFTSLISGCIVFAIIGHLAHVTEQPDIRKVVKSGPGLTFETYPDAIAKFDFLPQLFSILFFFMLFLLGIGTLIGIVTSVITAIHDQNPHWKRWKVVLVVSFVGFCIGLVYLTPGGLFILDLVDYYGATFVTLTLAVFELLTFGWIYGVDRVCKDIEFMLEKRTGLFWRICWGVVTPIVVLVILLFSIVNYVPKDLPSGYNAFGWCLYTVAVLQLPVWGIYAWYKESATNSIQKVRNILNPMSGWGPEDAAIRSKYNTFMSEHEAASSVENFTVAKYIRRKLLE
ncbi:sodium-dependent nutrient amino acid transporter 1-like [Topomyia yanbarensis]|uniref:sodium-dependent nutrient amino acid transporter 1-like n=1 Tax=Topomyia yanbarensis TaxID=2498891 RepID=UPI00273C3EE3|nr:sodium-dependent nutrient amino acid transporter 1-like [Topomyia yanbarensis]